MHACIACTIHALTLLDDLDLGLVYFKFMSFTRNMMRNAVCSIIVPCIDFYFLILSSYPGHSKKSIYSDLISTMIGTHILRNEGFHTSTLAGLAREIGSSWSQGQPNQNKIRNSTTRVFPLFTQISNCYERCIFNESICGSFFFVNSAETIEILTLCRNCAGAIQNKISLLPPADTAQQW